MKLIKAGRSAVQAAEAVPAGMDLKKGLDLAVHEKLVAQDAIEVEQVEEKQTLWVEHLVGKQQGHVELAAGKMEPGALVPGVQIVAEKDKAGEPLVDVLRGEIHAVVVVPEGAQAFPDIALWRMGAVGPSQRIGVVLVIILPPLKKVTGEAVALRWGMSIVHVGRDRGDSETAVLVGWRQIIVVPEQDRLPILPHMGRPGDHAVKAPQSLERKVWVHLGLDLALMDFEKLQRGRRQGLMVPRAPVEREPVRRVDGGVRAPRGWRGERSNRLRGGHDGERFHE